VPELLRPYQYRDPLGMVFQPGTTHDAGTLVQTCPTQAEPFQVGATVWVLPAGHVGAGGGGAGGCGAGVGAGGGAVTGLGAQTCPTQAEPFQVGATVWV
jgi:hypothetical protein